MTASNEPDPVSVDPGQLRLTDSDGTSGVLLGMRCRNCGIYVFGPAIFCQACTSDNLESVELGRQGTLYSYTMVRVPPAGWPGPVPYVLGEVELPEGPHVLAELIDLPEADLEIGLAVELALQQVHANGEGNRTDKPGLVVYKWRPASSAPASLNKETL